MRSLIETYSRKVQNTINRPERRASNGTVAASVARHCANSTSAVIFSVLLRHSVFSACWGLLLERPFTHRATGPGISLRYWSSSTGTSGIFWSTAFTNWYTIRSSKPDGSIASSSASYPSSAGTTTIYSGPAIPSTTNTPCMRPTTRKSYSLKKSTSKVCGSGLL